MCTRDRLLLLLLPHLHPPDYYVIIPSSYMHMTTMEADKAIKMEMMLLKEDRIAGGESKRENIFGTKHKISQTYPITYLLLSEVKWNTRGWRASRETKTV